MKKYIGEECVLKSEGALLVLQNEMVTLCKISSIRDPSFHSLEQMSWSSTGFLSLCGKQLCKTRRLSGNSPES